MRRFHVTCCAFVLLVAGASAGELPEQFTLGKYVPADAWVYVHEINNPQRQFIDDHVRRVMRVAARAGIDEEIKRFVLKLNAVGDDERERFDEHWNAMIDAVKRVPWMDLGGREFVFAQRIRFPIPNYMFLCRPAPEKVEASAASLERLFRTIASLRPQWQFSNRRRGKAKVGCISCGVGTFELFRQGDVIGISVGSGGTNDVLALMADDAKGRSIIDSKRFKSALDMVQPPGDRVDYYRVTQLWQQLRDAIEAALHMEKHSPEKEAEIALFHKVFLRAVAQVDVLDYGIGTRRTEGTREVWDSVAVMNPAADDTPLYKAVTQRKRFDTFDRFVPADAKAFGVHTLVDLQTVYHGVLHFLETEIPREGPNWVEAWAGIQKSIGFNLDRDIFNWLSGEIIWVELPGTGAEIKTVVMLRTRDPRLAQQKVNAALDKIATLTERWQVVVSPAPTVQADGFRSVFHPMMMMMQVKPVVGVYGEWLVIGTGARDVNKCLAVAQGEAPSIRTNPRFQREGLLPDGPVNSASFTDLSRLGDEMSIGFGMMGMYAAMIPESPETLPAKATLSLMARLAPVLAELDYFSSQSSVSSYHDGRWRCKMVLTYQSADQAAEQ